MRWWRPASLGVVAFAVLASCDRGSPVEEGASELETRALTITTDDGRVTLDVEIADSPAEKARGLMGRTSLAPGTGMAFLYDEPTDGGFTMRNTLVPLSIAFWDSDGRIVDLFDMEPCPEEPCPGYFPSASYVGAVEVPQGTFEREGVGIGDVVELGG